MGGLLTIAQLTLHDARRRRVLLAALLCGLAFLLVFGVMIFLVNRDLLREGEPLVRRQLTLSLLTIAGLFATNFLSVLLAVLLPIDTLSGEIDSGVMQTLASKPVGRWQILLGKWLAHAALASSYLLFVAGGVLLAGRLAAGHAQVNVQRALPLMVLEVVLLVTVSIAGGTRLSTVTNGIAALGFYGIAFIGGWVEQIGGLVGVRSAQMAGTIASLISPPDSLWRRAAWELQPPLARDLGASPFTPVSVPSALAVWWAVAFTVAVLAWAVRSFQRRAL
jgi:ABC-type transport system involved in multi-copper enzyme maturation permease subunit